MKIVKLVCILMLVLATILNAQKWQKIEMKFPPGDTLLQTSSISFATKNTGWICTSGYFGSILPPRQHSTKILKTTNGGKDWFLQKYVSDTYDRDQVFTTDSLHCWAYDSYGNLIFTTDGGSNWMNIYIGGSPAVNQKFFFGLYFFNNDEGIAINRTRPWFTKDGGKSWTAGDSSKIELTTQDISFTGKNKGWIVNGGSPYRSDGGNIANTTNGGKTWRYQDSSTTIVTAVDFTDSLHGCATATNWFFDTGFVYSTTDGGKNWQLSQFLYYGPFWDIGFIDDKNGWITGAGKILNTTDGGITWKTQEQGMQYALLKLIVLKKEKVAYVLGSSYLTSNIDFGPPFILLSADLNNLMDLVETKENLPKEFQLMQNYPNPFNPGTIIKYSVPFSPSPLQGEGSRVRLVTLKVYDLLGREITTLVNEVKQPGYYEAKFNGAGLPSGVYYYRLFTGTYSETKKMLLIK